MSMSAITIGSNGKEDSSSLIDGGRERCAFDLGNLLATNTHQVNAAQLYRPANSNKAQSPAIEANGTFRQLWTNI